MGPLFLFFLLFFLPFFFIFIFFPFFLFLFISSFFECFSFSFFFHFFLKKKSFLFLFFCISFKYVLLLALVSKFNCFLRSRCSMEMWCPDDIGRDSWDWVGPLAWERACFNSPEWGGGSSPVRTEPPQIVLLLLLLLLWCVVVVLWLLLLFQTHMKVCVCAQHLNPACSYKLIKKVQTWRRGPVQKPRELPNPSPDLSRIINPNILITTPPVCDEEMETLECPT